ncbi:hypothetical protein N0V87_005663 [Didymella glomerata]|uniref:Uncharacterized protein n=1 Tax=Didymella glomerata TaxID=749621 RepID=A0A9W8WY23_9PLEO|nr:hypothetical protein N0V87_005663 [Didymella glomerata]
MKLLVFLFALMNFFAATIAGSGGRDLPTCKDESLQCGGGNPGGGVFVCRKGSWDILVPCAAGESCVTDPVPTCTWAKAITGFEIPGTLVAADVKKKAAVASTALVDDKTGDATKAETTDDTPYYNICSPCIRHNDYCKGQCDWQGRACDLHCNQQTCSVNLTTGDWHQPTVSCGHSCEWPCS